MASQMEFDRDASQSVVTGNHLRHGDLLDRKSVRGALKSWNDSRELGRHPLACLNIVEARRLTAGYANSPAGRGIALREVLRDAIETLKPDANDPNFQDRRWRSYIIVMGQYVEGRYPDFLTDQLGVGRSMYHREQARALDILADILHRWEQGADVPDSVALGLTALSQDGCEASFLAPLRPPYDLVGRDVLLQDLKRQLLAGDNLALCALNGLPGVGKTALAIELANDPDVRAHFRDGVLWTGLGRKPDVPSLLGAWGVALGVSSHELSKLSSVEDRAWAIHAIIGTRRMLLVVDDAWKVGAALTFKVGGNPGWRNSLFRARAAVKRVRL
jgi:hypothetical protein